MRQQLRLIQHGQLVNRRQLHGQPHLVQPLIQVSQRLNLQQLHLIQRGQLVELLQLHGQLHGTQLC